MKMYKLLFFLIALVSLNSCAEYVGNGEEVDNPDDNPQGPSYVARLVDNKAKYVGDDFEFEALLDGVDVTESTTFKVNGTEINGNVYVPHRAGDNSVIATLDNNTANFKFTVLEKEEEEPEPEPTGNRIEYDGEIYPMTHTAWRVNTTRDPVTQQETPKISEIDLFGSGVEKYTIWHFQSMDTESFPMADNGMSIIVYVPLNQNEEPQKPYEAPKLYYHASVSMKANGLLPLETFNPLDEGYPVVNFVSKSDSSANYTIEVKKGNEYAKLYWNGAYTTGTNPQN